MSNRRVQRLLVISILTAMFFIFVGSFTYYYLVSVGVSVAVVIAQALQNTAEALLFNPILSIADMYDNAAYVAHLGNVWVRGITGLYSIAMVVAPVTDALIIYSIVTAVIKSFLMPGRLSSKRVLVVGYNERVKKILDHGFTDTTVYLWSEDFLQDDEEAGLFLKRIRVVEHGTQITDDEKLLKRVNRFLAKKKITDVLIADESDARNVYLYSMISSLEVCDARTIHFYVQNSTKDAAKVLEGIFNSQVLNTQNGSTSDTHRDLNIFSVDEVRARQSFNKLPVFCDSEKPGNYDVNMLIIGGGRHGQTFLRTAMNQLVYSSSSSITVDILDKDIKAVQDNLVEHFDETCVVWKNKNTIMKVKPDAADGSFTLRLTEGAASDDALLTLAELQGNRPYNYVIVTLPNLEANMNCATLLKNFRLVDENTSIVFRLPDSKRFKNALTSYVGTEKIYLMGSDVEYLGLDQIINSEENEKIRGFNLNYEKLAASMIDGADSTGLQADVLWNMIEYFKRRSSRALYNHKNVKEYLCGISKNLAKECSAFSKAAEDMNLPEGYRGDELSTLLITTKNDKPVYPELLEMAMTEHRRWTYFFISEGWRQEIVDGNHPLVKKLVKEGETEKKAIKNVKNINKLNNIHDCIVNWETLAEVNRQALIYDLIWCPEFLDEPKNN